MNYIVVWKDTPGQQVSTVVDANNQPVERDSAYLQANGIPIIEGDLIDIHDILAQADGRKIALPRKLVPDVLGWDV